MFAGAARHSAQSAHGASAGGACGVRHHVDAGGTAGAVGGDGAARCGAEGAYERAQRVHQPQPALCEPGGGRGRGGLQPADGGGRRAAAGGVRRAAVRGRRDCECGFYDWRRCGRRSRLCDALCLLSGGGVGSAVAAGVAPGGAGYDAPAGGLRRARRDALRLRMGRRRGGVGEHVVRSVEPRCIGLRRATGWGRGQSGGCDGCCR